MAGHLRAGANLLGGRDLQQASLHFAHPEAEIYHEAEKLFPAFGVAPFRSSLKRTLDLAIQKAPRSEIQAALGIAKGDIDRALEKVASTAKLSVAGTARAVVVVMQAAAQEYDGSIKAGRFVNIEEYQDARGFVLSIRDYLSRATALRKYDGRAYALLTADVEELAKALQAPIPPKTPPLTTEKMYGTVARVELNASTYLSADSQSQGGDGGEGAK